MEEFQYKVLEALQVDPDLSQRALASKVGMSLGKTNYCVRALIEKGWLKASSFRRSPNKVAYAYLLTPQGVEAKYRATADFLRRKLDEYDALEVEIARLRDEVRRDAGKAGLEAGRESLHE